MKKLLMLFTLLSFVIINAHAEYPYDDFVVDCNDDNCAVNCYQDNCYINTAISIVPWRYVNTVAFIFSCPDEAKLISVGLTWNLDGDNIEQVRPTKKQFDLCVTSKKFNSCRLTVKNEELHPGNHDFTIDSMRCRFPDGIIKNNIIYNDPVFGPTIPTGDDYFNTQ